MLLGLMYKMDSHWEPDRATLLLSEFAVIRSLRDSVESLEVAGPCRLGRTTLSEGVIVTRIEHDNLQVVPTDS